MNEELNLKIYKIILKEYTKHSHLKNKITWHKRLENLGIKIFQNKFEELENYFDINTEAMGRVQVPIETGLRILILGCFP